jgi:hypothetical protein
LSNLSRVWACFRLTKKLGLSMQELTALLAMLRIEDALESPERTRAVREAVVLMKKWRISVADLRFWLLHKTQNAEEEKKRVIPDLAIARLLSERRKALRAISDARPAKEIETADEIATTPDRGDGMTACLEKLASALSQIPELTAEKAQQLMNLLQQHVSKKAVGELRALLTDCPLGKIDKVSDLANEAPVNASGAWIEIPDDTITHLKYQEWTFRLVHALLDYADRLARNEVVIRLVGQAFRAPVEQMDAILQGCRMPKNGAPAQGGTLLDTFAASG